MSEQKKDYDLEHMPKFIKEAPWYMSKDGKGEQEETILFHQRIEHDKRENINNWYQKGYRKQPIVTKFRKGACENCGAITHKTKECLERPRKVGAKWSERNIARDEYDTSKQNVKLNYESKRDRWNGYNPDTYQKQVIEEWNLKEKIVKEKKQKDGFSSDSGSEEETDKVGGQNHNLRIREDTAKYLRNLDPNSAPYDPKSRSMKANPNPNLPESDQDYKGDNFIKISGDYLSLIKNEGFMLEVNKHGLSANTLGMPSQFELLQKEYKAKKEQIMSSKMQNIISKYGDQEAMPIEMQEQLKEEYDQQQMDVLEEELEKQRKARAMLEEKKPSNLLEAGGEAKVVKRSQGLTGAVRSKYEKIDAPPGGHSQVWGSYWHPVHKWGYKCCQSFVKKSNCEEERNKVVEPAQKRQKRHDSESD